MTLDSSFAQKLNPLQPKLSFAGILKIAFSIAFFNMLFFNITANAASLNSVNIKSNLDPNAITITEVDIVFLYDQDLIEDFPMSKSRWYSMRRTLTQTWSDSMDVISVFIPQGFDSNTAVLPERKLDAVKVYVFGQHDEATAIPVDVTDLSAILVTIDDLGIIVTSRD
jgi:hypothetical protein